MGWFGVPMPSNAREVSVLVTQHGGSNRFCIKVAARGGPLISGRAFTAPRTPRSTNHHERAETLVVEKTAPGQCICQ